MGKATHSSGEVAKEIGVSIQTLHDWMKSGHISTAKSIAVGKKSILLWTKADIKKARKFKGTLKKGRRPKKK
jgi:DNA-binding transcriptional MerR regulator